MKPRRSVLFMPGSNARAMDKARTLPADALILDLEDAVAPEAKAVARAQVLAAVGAGGYGPREVIVRVNGLGHALGRRRPRRGGARAPPTPCCCPRSSPPRPSPRRSRASGPAPAVWCMLETPRGILNAAAIAARQPARGRARHGHLGPDEGSPRSSRPRPAAAPDQPAALRAGRPRRRRRRPRRRPPRPGGRRGLRGRLPSGRGPGLRRQDADPSQARSPPPTRPSRRRRARSTGPAG